ncbi:diguanylate cyclase domain-containing protein [Vibrio rotiferianus]|uniref:diguanylate cyclase domain-containing protein n=1 Tax=Vibrio rotiferianus TaxID=190895 RepID=UPI00406A2322
MSVRTKLLWPILLLVLFAFITMKGNHSYKIYQVEKSQLIESTQVLIKGISHSLEAPIRSRDLDSTLSLMSAFFAEPSIIRVKILDSERSLFAMLESDTGVARVPNDKEKQEITSLGYAFSPQFVYVMEPILVNGEVIAFVRVTLSSESLKQIKESLFKDALLFMLLTFITSVLLVYLVNKLVVSPINALNNAMNDFAEGRDSEPFIIPFESSDEIGDLINSFKTMTARFRQRESQAQFTLQKLEKDRAFLESIINGVQYSLIVTDTEGHIHYQNQQSQKAFGATSLNTPPSNILDLVRTREPQILDKIVKLSLERSQIHLSQMGKETRQFSLTSLRLTGVDKMLFTVEDITRVEEALSKQRIATRVFENSDDGLLVLNQDGIITMVNSAVTSLFGSTSEKLTGMPFFNVLKLRELQIRIPNIIENIEHYGQWQGEVVEQNHLGKLIPLFVKVNRIFKEGRTDQYDIVILLTDLSGSKEMERLEYLAHHDPLTGLANRAKFHKELESLLIQSGYLRDEFAVLYLDLDGFKAVNDTYGHDAGDEVLQAISRRLSGLTRHNDMVARLSGDEFVFLMNPTNQTEVTRFVEKIIKSVSQPIEYKDVQLTVGVSIGVKLVGQNEKDAPRVLKNADNAMYEAKRAGKGQAVLIGTELEATV